MAEVKHNLKNLAVKRILQELKEMQQTPSDDFTSLPLEDNMFEWQFAIRGPPDTEFEGGIYHGRIQLPAEYPFQPPSFILLTVTIAFTQDIKKEKYSLYGTHTHKALMFRKVILPLPITSCYFASFQPNGRFETQTKICLSISNHHPEHWQPSWSVRTALLALIAFLPTEPGGALGSLDHSKEERRALAIKSHEAAPKFGTPERQILIDEIHQYMLSKAPPIPQLRTETEEQTINTVSEAPHINNQPDGAPVVGEELAAVPGGNYRIVEDVREVHWNANAGPVRVRFSARLRSTRRVAVNPDEQPSGSGGRRSRVFVDRILILAAIGLTLAIVVLLLKKLLKASGYDMGGMAGM